jgi:anthranilate/para-aminobenzoate synthase component II
VHGKTSDITHDGRTIFAGLTSPMTVARYHSLVVTDDSFDHDRFEVSAWLAPEDENGPSSATDSAGGRVVMAMRARPGVFGDAPLEGVQFHPESFMTPDGPAMLANFLGLPTPAPLAA